MMHYKFLIIVVFRYTERQPSECFINNYFAEGLEA